MNLLVNFVFFFFLSSHTYFNQSYFYNVLLINSCLKFAEIELTEHVSLCPPSKAVIACTLYTNNSSHK